jgi:hypothetical protein
MQLTAQQNIRSGPLASSTLACPVTWRRSTELAWYVVSLALVAALGSLKLALPLHRDGATFLWLAIQVDRGAVLYVDVWDVKQPGIFIFDYLAGKLFGFTPEGVHLFELLWHLAFAVLVMIALRPTLTHRWLAAVAPAAFLAGYYVFCEAHQQTQLEILVGLPLFVAAWCTSISRRSRGRRTLGFVCAGIAAGVATSFKHVLAPIPVAFVVAASIEVLRRNDDRRASTLIFSTWLPFTFGVLLVWGSMSIAFWRLGALDAFLSTTFLYPLGALNDIGAAPLSRLLTSLMIFGAAMAPWLVYATFSAPRLARADEPALFGRMAVWLVTGIAVILLQKSSWWTYHMLLLYPPTGVLAARGLDLAVGHLRAAVGSSTFPAMIASLLLVIPVLAALAYPAGETARRLYTSIAEHGDFERYRRTASVDYANAADAATFLERTAPPGSIYVFGDPTIHLLTGRRQAIPLQGSAWDFYLPSHWQQLPTDLAVARPVWNLPGIDQLHRTPQPGDHSFARPRLPSHLGHPVRSLVRPQQHGDRAGECGALTREPIQRRVCPSAHLRVESD